MSFRIRVSILPLAMMMVLFASASVFPQTSYPRPSQRQSVEQTIGDTELRIVYHRPNLKGRAAFGTGAIIPFGQVWRAGANEATVFEFTNDVKVNGKELKKGKYSFYLIPRDGDWTVIFNKSWNQWGTQYSEDQDAVRFEVTPIAGDSTETLAYSIEDVTDSTARIVLEWDSVRLPFTVDVGDVDARILASARREMLNDPVDAASFVLTRKIAGSYEEAVRWLDGSIALFETYGALFTKARLLAEMGRRSDAVAVGEKALEIGRKNSVNPNSLAFLERLINEWKSE